jgi:hypothetical protein
VIIVTGPAYGAATPRTHRPPKVTGGKGYQKYRNCLRLEAEYTCVYCLSTEREVGPSEAFGGFEVEHFHPKGLAKFKKQANHYFNLLWACKACNRAKSNVWPSKTQLAAGSRFLDPTRDNLNDHMAIVGNEVKVLNGSPAAKYTISRLRLNSETHQDRRQQRTADDKAMALLDGTIQLLEERAAQLPAGSSLLAEVQGKLEEVRVRLREKLRTTPPRDAVADCLCTSSCVT